MMNFITLREQILACTDCESRFGFKPIPIVHGEQSSKILQISQAPSQSVHLTQKPFNDSTGKKLRYEWYRISDEDFYNTKNFYISAIAHCFPGKNRNGGDNPPPKYCADKWLRKEIEFVNHEIVILIGKKAADYFFPKANYESLIFEDQLLNGKPTFILPHPSPLNMHWLKVHPEFEQGRLAEIRKVVWRTIGKANAE